MLNGKKFQKIYNDYLASGPTVKDFCFNQNILPGKFFYWQNKLKVLLLPKQGFVTMLIKQDGTTGHFYGLQKHQLQPSLNATKEYQTCEINFPNRVNLKLTG